MSIVRSEIFEKRTALISYHPMSFSCSAGVKSEEIYHTADFCHRDNYSNTKIADISREKSPSWAFHAKKNKPVVYWDFQNLSVAVLLVK